MEKRISYYLQLQFHLVNHESMVIYRKFRQTLNTSRFLEPNAIGWLVGYVWSPNKDESLCRCIYSMSYQDDQPSIKTLKISTSRLYNTKDLAFQCNILCVTDVEFHVG